MTLRLEITSEHKELVGDDFERSFGIEGGTIGRSLENDWVLPDTERYISGRHATIDCQAGAFYLADVSSNGVYVNGAMEPLGKGNPRRLFDGDRLRMGNFEFRVHLDEGEDLAMPPAPKPTVVPDHIEQLVPVDDLQSSVMLLDEEEITGESVFTDDFLRGDREQRQQPPPAAEAPRAERPAASPPAAAPDDAGDADELLETFLRSAGVDPNDIHPSVDRSELMSNAGRVLGELVSGITELLVARSNVKGMFRLDQTTVLPRHNNPLKLSASLSDSLKQLLVGREGEYLGPLDSVREACRDLKYHHDAVISAMIRAFREYMDRFDPNELEEQFRQAGDKKPMFNALAKRKYWDFYCDYYPVMAQTGNATLPQQFSEDFVRQYEKQLADFRRMERTLGDTRKLDMSRVSGARPAARTEAVAQGMETTAVADDEETWSDSGATGGIEVIEDTDGADEPLARQG